MTLFQHGTEVREFSVPNWNACIIAIIEDKIVIMLDHIFNSGICILVPNIYLMSADINILDIHFLLKSLQVSFQVL